MRFLCLILVTIVFACMGQSNPPRLATSAPAATQPVPAEIKALIGDLRSRKFTTREQAQHRLQALRATALPHLIPLLNDSDAEVASRAAEIVGKPSDPGLRVEVAIRLLATADPDWMERGVHMIFEDPIAFGELFIARTRNDAGTQRIITEPVSRQLEATLARLRNFQKHYDRLLREKPEAAAKQKQMTEETNAYEAEAAYWTAYESLLEHRRQLGGNEGSIEPTTQPRE